MEVALKYFRKAYNIHNTHNSSILVYYHATEKEVEQYWSKYSVSDVSNLSAENRFVVESSSANQHTIMNDIKALAEEVKLERSDRVSSNHAAQKEIAELKQLVVDLLGKMDAMSTRVNNEEQP
jgi:hypothetical protein